MKIRISLFALLIGNLAASAAVEIGQTEKDLLQQEAKPLGRIVAGSKIVYRWPDKQVTVRDGIVTDIKVLDPEAEKAAAEHRAEVLAAQQQEMAVKKQVQDAVATAKTPAAQSKETRNAINARIAELRQEQNEATVKLQSAQTVGGKAKAAYYQSEIDKREKEIVRLQTLSK